MIIKHIELGCEIPPFYAPFIICPKYQYRATCTFIGLNIIFYFAVELYWCTQSLVRMSRRKHNQRAQDNDL